jgi:hypothetical protein
MDPTSYAVTVIGIVAITALGILLRLRWRPDRSELQTSNAGSCGDEMGEHEESTQSN